MAGSRSWRAGGICSYSRSESQGMKPGQFSHGGAGQAGAAGPGHPGNLTKSARAAPPRHTPFYIHQGTEDLGRVSGSRCARPMQWWECNVGASGLWAMEGALVIDSGKETVRPRSCSSCFIPGWGPPLCPLPQAASQAGPNHISGSFQLLPWPASSGETLVTDFSRAPPHTGFICTLCWVPSAKQQKGRQSERGTRPCHTQGSAASLSMRQLGTIHPRMWEQQSLWVTPAAAPSLLRCTSVHLPLPRNLLLRNRHPRGTFSAQIILLLTLSVLERFFF